VPLLLIERATANSGSARGLLLWLGVIGYAARDYAFYLFGAALNAFCPLYLAALVLTEEPPRRGAGRA
jgi:hypothetical protein